MNQNSLLLSEASFVMSHDAATGYLPSNSLSYYAATNSYSKNQIGNVYQQLNDGARALDVRPKLSANGTLLCHHGSIVIPVTLEQLVIDAIQWCRDNPEELVLILHHDLSYSTISTQSYNKNDDDSDDQAGGTTAITPSADVAVAALSQVYEALGVTYVHCSDLYGLTVGETMELAALSSYGGYLLAMDQHDAYASSCAKQNYVEPLVTCYSNSTSSGNNGNEPCTNPKSSHHQALKAYVMASANNEPTENNQQLGPPASTYKYPFNEIQALWQVDAVSASLGLAHLSTLIDDNIRSKLNAQVVDWVYNGYFDSISLLVIDHVQLNGNALSSVLRNQCGQSELSAKNNDDNNGAAVEGDEFSYENELCGIAIPKPKLFSKPMSTLSFFVTMATFAVFGIWIFVLVAHYRRYYAHNKTQLEALDRELLETAQQCGCATGREDHCVSMAGIQTY